MKRILTILWTLAGISSGLFAQRAHYVDPFIGTAGMGHTFPGACVPFGGVQLSPDTDMIPHNIEGVYQPRTYEYCAGYQYGDSTIVGFSHTHFSGTGHSDLGDILLMPGTGKSSSFREPQRIRIPATASVSIMKPNRQAPGITRSRWRIPASRWN